MLNTAVEKRRELNSWALEIIMAFFHKLETADAQSPTISAYDIFISSGCKGIDSYKDLRMRLKMSCILAEK